MAEYIAVKSFPFEISTVILIKSEKTYPSSSLDNSREISLKSGRMLSLEALEISKTISNEKKQLASWEKKQTTSFLLPNIQSFFYIHWMT